MGDRVRAGSPAPAKSLPGGYFRDV